MSSPYRDVATIQNIANSSTIIEHRDDANEEGVYKFRNENNVDPDVEHPDDHESARTRLRGITTISYKY